MAERTAWGAGRPNECAIIEIFEFQSVVVAAAEKIKQAGGIEVHPFAGKANQIADRPGCIKTEDSICKMRDTFRGGTLNRKLIFSLGLLFLTGFSTRSAAQDSSTTSPSQATENSPPSQAAGSQASASDPKPSSVDPPQPKIDPSTTNTPQQTKRILGIIPNYRAISANTQLPPLSVKAKFWLGTQDTFDYSNFIFVGMLSGVAMADKSEPSCGQGAAGYGRYYWHTFVDVGVGNYMTESIVPTLTKEDPRYYP